MTNEWELLIKVIDDVEELFKKVIPIDYQKESEKLITDIKEFMLAGMKREYDDNQNEE